MATMPSPVSCVTVPKPSPWMMPSSASKYSATWAVSASGVICSEMEVKPAMSVKSDVISRRVPPMRAASPRLSSSRMISVGT